MSFISLQEAQGENEGILPSVKFIGLLKINDLGFSPLLGGKQ
jgi:hypothetical protein